MKVTKIVTILSAAAVPFAAPAVGQQPGAASPQPAPPAQPQVEIEAEPEELIETFGLVIGLQSGMGDLDLTDEEFDAFIEGLRRVHAGEGIPDNINEIVPQMQAYLTERQAGVVEGRAAEHRAEADTFFAELDERDDVEQSEEGLYYTIEEQGDGESPDPTDTVLVHYEGRLIDGTVFDSSIQRGEPAEFPMTGIIQGMTIGLSKLQEGGKATFYIPPDLGYGDESQPTIPPGSALIFEVELLEVREAAAPQVSPEMVPEMPQQ